MKKEIVGWYSDRHYQPHKMISAFSSRHDFSQAQIEAAMIHCYNKIVNEGKLILDVDVARYVRNVCKDVDTEERDRDLMVLYESKDKLESYNRIAAGFFAGGALIGALLLLFYATWGVIYC